MSEHRAVGCANEARRPAQLSPASDEGRSSMATAFEWFRDPHGRLTTSTSVPYNELFSIQEIRRLTFTRLQVSQNQDLAPMSGERGAAGASWPPTSSPTGSWLLLGAELAWGPPRLLTAFLASTYRWSLWYGECLSPSRLGAADRDGR